MATILTIFVVCAVLVLIADIALFVYRKIQEHKQGGGEDDNS